MYELEMNTMDAKELYDLLNVVLPDSAYMTDWDGHPVVTIDGQVDLAVLAEQLTARLARPEEARVFIIEKGYDYEGHEAIGVLPTRAAAEAAVEAMKAEDWHPDDWRITEWVVGEYAYFPEKRPSCSPQAQITKEKP